MKTDKVHENRFEIVLIIKCIVQVGTNRRFAIDKKKLNEMVELWRMCQK